MKKAVIIGVVALVAIAVIAGVLVNNKDDSANNSESSPSSSTSTSGANSSNNSMQQPANETNNDSSGTSQTRTASATIKDFAFTPTTLTVKKGTKVTWTNQDSVTHTVTGNNGGPDSGNLAQGDSYSYTFNTVGTFEYHCAPHPNMTGTVTVTE